MKNIISDERELGFTVGKCDDCGKTKPVRRVNQVSFITEQNRGWVAWTCFDCRRPVVKWITPDGREMETPVENPFNVDGTTKTKSQ